MADSLLCLDINQETAAAVRLERSGKVTTVVACASCPIGDRPLAEICSELRLAAGSARDRVMLSLGAELFLLRNLELPFTGKRQIAQVLPFELAEQTPLAVDELVVDFFVTGGGEKGSEVVAAMLPRQTLIEKRQAWREAGLEIDSVGLSGLASVSLLVGQGEGTFLLLDCSASRVTLFLGAAAGISLIRCLPLPSAAVSEEDAVKRLSQPLKQSLLATAPAGARLAIDRILLTGERSQFRRLTAALVSIFPEVTPEQHRVSAQPLLKFAAGVRADYRPEVMDRALALGLARPGKGLRLEFLQGDLRPRRLSGRRRKIAGFAGLALAACLVLVIGSFGKDYADKLARQEQLNQEIIALYRETIPEATRIVNPVQQLQVINNELRKTYRPGGDSATGSTVIQLLSELSARIPESLDVRIGRLVADMESVRLRGVTKDFNSVDTVQKELVKSPLFRTATISSASQSLVDDEVRFEMKLVLAGRQ